MLGNCTWDRVRERLGSQDFGEVRTDGTIISTVELDDVVLNTCGAENRPELHCRFRGQLAEVASQSTDVFFAEF